MSTDRGAVLVTGSSTGIGRATALHLDRLGFQVFAGVRKRGDAESLESEGSDRLEPVIIDVTEEGIDRGPPPSGSSSAAAAASPASSTTPACVVGGPLETVPLDELRRQLEVNVVGQVAVTQAFLPMIRAARGRIVLMSSIGGRNSSPSSSPTRLQVRARGARRLAAPGDAPVRRRGLDRRAGVDRDPDLGQGRGQVARVSREAMTPEQHELYEHGLENVEDVAQRRRARGSADEGRRRRSSTR